MTQTEELMNTEDVAELLNVSEVTVRYWARQGVIPAFKLGRHVRYDRQAITRWLENSSTYQAARESADAVPQNQDSEKARQSYDWNNLLLTAGFSQKQISILREMKITSLEALTLRLATRAQRVGLCAMLDVTQKTMDDKVSRLLDLFN